MHEAFTSPEIAKQSFFDGFISKTRLISPSVICYSFANDVVV
jgi:hypothetical protein